MRNMSFSLALLLLVSVASVSSAAGSTVRCSAHDFTRDLQLKVEIYGPSPSCSEGRKVTAKFFKKARRNDAFRKDSTGAYYRIGKYRCYTMLAGSQTRCDIGSKIVLSGSLRKNI